MSVEQCQKVVNTYDKEIADLEKKQAEVGKKMFEAQRKENSISIPKSASSATVQSKLKLKEKYHSDYLKASRESADIQKRISDKRKKRNEAYLKLQKEEQLRLKLQNRKMEELQSDYEKRIQELQLQSLPVVTAMDVQENNSIPEYDVFISHATEDKESFVDELVMALRRLEIRVWYDTSEINWGDSMRKCIDNGLKKSRFGIVVLSPNYIAENKYWTAEELNGLFQMESIKGKMILPIWHNLTKQQVVDYSPIIANKKAMTTAIMTAQEIAEELAKLIHHDDSEEQL